MKARKLSFALAEQCGVELVIRIGIWREIGRWILP